MKRLMKLTSFVCAVAIVLSSSAYAAEVEQGSSEMLEKKVEALLDSKKTENHIEALKLLKENGYEVQETVYNEYDAYLEMKQALENAPAAVNHISDEYDEMREYVDNFKSNYAEKIEYLNTLTDEQLRFVNYRDDQIYAIRNYDGSDKMTRASSSECYVYGGFTNFKSTSSKTSVKLIAAFEWDGLYSFGALLASKDIFGVTWISPFKSDPDLEESYVTYKNVNTGTAIYDVEYTPKQEGMFASAAVFNISEMKYVGNNPVGHLVDSGSIICYLDTYTKETQVLGFAKYGKSTGMVTPAFDVTPDGVGMSISYVEKVSNAGSAGFRYPK
jgi:hypothetical protein